MEHERYVSASYRSGFAVAGLSTARLDASFPLGQWGRLHAGYSHFGDADYAEHQALAAYSMQIGPRVEVGIAAAYCLQAVADGHYRNRHYLAPEAMARISFTPRLQAMGLVGTRPWDEGRPWRLHVGMAYRAVAGACGWASNTATGSTSFSAPALPPHPWCSPPVPASPTDATSSTSAPRAIPSSASPRR